MNETLTPRAAAKIKRLREVAALYKKHGTAAGVAEALGVTRQRAAYLLSQADDAGVISYARRTAITTTKKQARDALRAGGSILAAARALGMDTKTFRTRFPDLVAEHRGKQMRK